MDWASKGGATGEASEAGLERTIGQLAGWWLNGLDGCVGGGNEGMER